MWFTTVGSALKSQKSPKKRLLSCEFLEDRRLLAIDFLPGDDSVGLSVGDQNQVAIETGGEGFLAVWTDERTVLSGAVNTSSPLSGNGQDIYGQLLGPDGQPMGGPIVVANIGQNQQKPDVAWNEAAQAWLVVFQSQDPDWYFDEHVYGVRVATDGSVLDQEPVLLFQQDGNNGYLDGDVASDGTNWTIVANTFYGDPLIGSIFARRMAADGSLLELEPQLIVQSDLMFPDIEFADNAYMIAVKHRTNDNVYVGRIDTQLNSLGSFTLVGAGDYPGPSLGSNGQQFMVVGKRAYRISTTGQVLDPGGIALGGSTLPQALRDVDWSGSAWTVGLRGPSTNLAFQRISDAGVLLDTQPVVVDSDILQDPIAITGTATGDAVMVYANRPASDENVRSVVIHSDGSFSNPTSLSIGLSRQSWVTSVDGAGDENLLVYISQTAGANRILSQRITDDGLVLDVEPTEIAVVANGMALSTPSVAWNGSVYLVAWNNLATRLSAGNAILDSQPIVVSDLPVGAVAAAGETFIVGLYEYHSFHEPLQYAVFVRVSGDGVVLDSTPILLSGGFVRSMTAASMGDQAIIAWGQCGRHDNTLASTQAIFVRADGTHGNVIGVSNGLGESPDIAVHGDQALFVYADDSTIHQDNIEGRFVLSDGSMPEWEFTISGANNEQIAPDVAWIGDQYVVAWSDYRQLEGIQQRRADIRAARVLPNGTVRDPRGFTVTNTPLPEDLPTVIGGNGNSWILFSMLNGENGVQEVQRIGYQFGPQVDYPLEPFRPTGPETSLARASRDNLGVLALAGEQHLYEFNVEQGERITAWLMPDNASATLSAEFVGLGNLATSAGPGQSLVVPLVVASQTGVAALQVTSDVPTAFHFEIVRNANAEALVETSAAVSLDVPVLESGAATLFAVEGMATGQVGGVGFQHYNDPNLFVDISATGTQLALDQGFYGHRSYITTTVGNDIFPAGTVTVGRDGIMLAGTAIWYLGGHEPLPDTFYLDGLPALAPLWTLLGANFSVGEVYYEETVVGGINTLIVQWTDLPHWHDFGAATFQVQVFETGPVQTRFVYQDITFGSPLYDGGADASVGVQISGSEAYQFSFDQPMLADGDVLDFTNLPTVVDTDEFTFELAAGDIVDLALQGEGPSLANAMFELVDGSGSVVASGSTQFSGMTIQNMDQGILGYHVTTSGTYTARLSTTSTTRYGLVVAQQMTLDTEPNHGGLLRSLNDAGTALGYTESQPRVITYNHYNNPAAFVDISNTGNQLFMVHDNSVGHLTTSVGNSLLPAGRHVIANDGVIMADHFGGYFSGSDHGPLPSLFFDSAALVPFWSDLWDAPGNVYYEQRQVNGVETLIVQWDHLALWLGTNSATFQVQVFNADPNGSDQLVSRFVYQDVDLGDPFVNGGANGTVGVQVNPNMAVQMGYNTNFLSNGDVIDVYVSADDRYAIDLAAGQTMAFETATPFPQSNALDPGITVLDAAGDILATDLNSSADGKNARLQFTAPVAGTYLISVFSENSEGEYLLTAMPSTTLPGDFDQDGDYDVADLDALTVAVSGGGLVSPFDMNGDQQLSMEDVDMWRVTAGNHNLGSGLAYLPADANLDGIVDGSDFIAWNANKFTPDGRWSHGDFNVDGFVDGSDFIVWNAGKFTQSTSVVATRRLYEPDGSAATQAVERVFGRLAASSQDFGTRNPLQLASGPTSRLINRHPSYGMFARHTVEREHHPEDACSRIDQLFAIGVW